MMMNDERMILAWFAETTVVNRVCINHLVCLEKIMLGLPASAVVNRDSDLSCDVGGGGGGGSCNPPIITHTAATPMATPQGSPNEVSCGSRDARNTLAVEHAFAASYNSSTDSLEKVPVSFHSPKLLFF